MQPDYLMRFTADVGSFTHLLALERVGPTHTRESIGFAGKVPHGMIFRAKCPNRNAAAACRCGAGT